MSGRGPGRRPGGPDTKSEILEAARVEFARRGYDRTTMRGIAARAGVDPSLIHHYFGSKDELFATTMDLAFDASVVLAVLGEADMSTMGRRLAEVFFFAWEQEEVRSRLLGILRSAMGGEDRAVEAFRQFLTSVLVDVVAHRLEGDEAELRALLMASHLIGIAMTRYVMRLAPIADATVEEIIEMVAPRLQSYVDGSVA